MKELEKKQKELDKIKAQKKKQKQEAKKQFLSEDEQEAVNKKLKEKKELNLAREVFTADEMLKLWGQFF
jgi:hypothetical protein